MTDLPTFDPQTVVCELAEQRKRIEALEERIQKSESVNIQHDIVLQDLRPDVLLNRFAADLTQAIATRRVGQ